MTTVDWIVLTGFIGFVVLYGTWKSRNTNDVNGYIRAGRTSKWWVVALSIMATQASAITFLSTPGQAYVDGMRFVQFYLGLPIAMIILSITAVPIYNKLNVYTAYEYLEKRFDLKNRMLGSALFLTQRGLAAGFTIYAPSLILSVILGWEMNITIIIWARAVALHTEYDVEIHEAPVSPLALQGPRALDVMKELAPSVAPLPRYAWGWTSIAGVEVLVSRTGWSGEFGYEVFAPDVEPARRVWQEVRRASDPFGVLVTPVIGERAWERGVTDIRTTATTWGSTHSRWGSSTRWISTSARIHRAGRASTDRGWHDPARHAIAFTIDGEDVPELETFWPVTTPGGGERIGVVWQAGYSYALERHAGDALLDEPAEIGTRLALQSPSGLMTATVVSRPLVPEAASEP